MPCGIGVCLVSERLSQITPLQKIFLYDYDSVRVTGYYDDDANYHNRRNLGGGDGAQDYAVTDDGHNNDDYALMEEHQQSTADLFSRSLALVLVSTDLNLLLHAGRQAVRDQLSTLPPCRRAFLLASKFALPLFLAACASALQNDPHFLAVVGLGAILLQEAWRRCFRAWQRDGVVAAGADEVGILDESERDIPERSPAGGRNGVVGRRNAALFADDDDRCVTEKFESAAATLAKFEQEVMIDEIAVEVEPSPYKASGDVAVADSYRQLPE